MSLIERENDVDPFDVKRLDLIPQYIEALQAIFKELHVQRDTRRLLSSFSERAAQHKKQSDKNENTRLTSDELIFRIGLYGIENVVRRWEALQCISGYGIEPFIVVIGV